MLETVPVAFKDSYSNIRGSYDYLEETFISFSNEYLSFLGEESRELTNEEVNKLIQSEYWQNYLKGIDPFIVVSKDDDTLTETDDEVDLKVVWDVYSSLVNLLSAIQQSAVSLSYGVEYTLKTQEAYNNKMAEIDPSTGSQDGQVKQQQQIINLRAARDLENSKSQQWSTSMQAASDASNSQSQLLSAIIQQMSGIISVIFR